MKSIIEFEHGQDTCAVEPGEFCRWLGTSKFGTVYVCRLFGNQPLFDKAEEPRARWLERCQECKETFK